MNKQGDPLATWRLLSNVVAFEIIILQINITSSLNTTQNSSGKNGKLVKIADNNLEANANERARGPPKKVGEFCNVVEIADNLEAHVHKQTRGPLGNLATFVQCCCI